MFEKYSEFDIVNTSGIVSLDKIVEEIKKNNPKPGSASMFKDAYNLSKEKHEKDLRIELHPVTKDRLPFFSHPSQVSWMLAVAGHDFETASIGVMHDLMDLNCSLELYKELSSSFGLEIASSVSALSGFDSYTIKHPENSYEKKFWKQRILTEFILNSARYPRIVPVKLADRANNMMTFDLYGDAAKDRIWRETKYFLLPLAKASDLKLAKILEHYISLDDRNKGFLSDKEYLSLKLANTLQNYDGGFYNEKSSSHHGILQSLNFMDSKDMNEAFVNVKRRKGKYSLNLSKILGGVSPILESEYKDNFNKLKSLGYVAKNYLKTALALAHKSELVYSAETRMNLLLPVEAPTYSGIDDIKIDRNLMDLDFLTANIKVEKFDEVSLMQVRHELSLEEPITVIKNNVQPNYRLIFPGYNSKIDDLVMETHYPFFVMNVFTS